MENEKKNTAEAETPKPETPTVPNCPIMITPPVGSLKAAGIGDGRGYGTVAEDGLKSALEIVLTSIGIAAGAALVVGAVKAVGKMFD